MITKELYKTGETIIILLFIIKHAIHLPQALNRQSQHGPHVMSDVIPEVVLMKETGPDRNGI